MFQRSSLIVSLLPFSVTNPFLPEFSFLKERLEIAGEESYDPVEVHLSADRIGIVVQILRDQRRHEYAGKTGFQIQPELLIRLDLLRDGQTRQFLQKRLVCAPLPGSSEGPR